MLLDARQKTTNATVVRSKDARLNSCCANTIPTKRARFLVHCLGRIDTTTARKRPPIPDVEDLVFAPLAVEECNPFCFSVFFSCAIGIFSKSYRIPSTPKDNIPALPLRRTAIIGSNKLVQVFGLCRYVLY